MTIKILIDAKRNLNVFDEFNNFWESTGNNLQDLHQEKSVLDSSLQVSEL